MWNYTCEWDMGIEGPWKTKDRMIADLRQQHAYVFEDDPDYEDFDLCVAEGLYTFYEY